LSPRRLARLSPITDLIIQSPTTGGEVVQPLYHYYKIRVIHGKKLTA
jgi:hypothetical protein